MNIAIISESVISPKQCGGIHTAFLNHQQLLKQTKIAYTVNSLRNADIVHTHTMGPFALYKILTSPRTIISSHLMPESLVGSYKGAGLLQGVIKSYLRFVYNRCDLVLALTNKTKQDLRALGVTTDIAVLSNPVDTKTFYQKSSLRVQGRKKFGIAEKAFVVLGVGNVIPRKGIEEFIALAHKFPQYTFVWAGGKVFANVLRSRSTEYTKLLKQTPANVRFVGHVPHTEMPMLYNAADVFLLASKQEIAPMVVLEAAACGLPLVLKDLPEYHDLYDTLYIPCKTIEDFALAINKIQQKSDFYHKQSKASSTLAKTFNYETIGEQLFTVYQSLAKSK